MKALIPLEKNTETIEKIVSKKRKKEVKDRLKAILPSLTPRFQEYDDKKKNLQTLNTSTFLTAPLKNDLIECYEGNTQPLRDLKDLIKLSHPTNCQYCGLNNIFPFDHYAPKGIFPEFSALSNNLIPNCTECNTYKGEEWLDTSNSRQFINFYYDSEILEIRFLNCYIEFVDGLPIAIFSFDDQCALSPEQKRVAKLHLENLRLCERYKRNSNETVSMFIKEVQKNMYGQLDKLSDLQEILISKATLHRAEFGINYWEAALYEAMANDEEFLEYCLD